MRASRGLTGSRAIDFPSGVTFPAASIAPSRFSSVLGLFERCGRRGFEPGKGLQIGLAPHAEFQHRAGQIETANLRFIARGPLAMGPLGPQPQADARLRAAGTARPLIGRGLRDRRQLQAVHADVRIEGQRTGQAAIDHGGDAFDGERGLCDVRRQHDLAAADRPENFVLLLGRQVAVQRQHGQVPRGGRAIPAGVPSGGSRPRPAERRARRPACDREFVRRRRPRARQPCAAAESST